MHDASVSQVETFYTALAFKQNPHLKGKIEITFKPASRYLYEARRKSALVRDSIDPIVRLEIGFAPASPDWKERLRRAIIAAGQLRENGQPELVAHREHRPKEVH